jgi:DNA (cytosine-5)-methyltransferase 1
MEYERLQGFPDYWTLPNGYDANDDDTDTLRYTAVGNAVSVPVVEWIARRIRLEMGAPDHIATRDDIQSYVPEFSKNSWSDISLGNVDFSDTDKSYKWPKAGLAWEDSYIGGNISVN